MKITYGEKELFQSVTFITLGLGETKIVLKENDEVINFIFDFVSNDSEQNLLNSVPLDNNTLKLILTNWNNPNGTTLQSAWEVGIFKNRKLYIIFLVKHIGPKGNFKEVTFSAYLGEKVLNG